MGLYDRFGAGFRPSQACFVPRAVLFKQRAHQSPALAVEAG
jgi:hypothetical protein